MNPLLIGFFIGTGGGIIYAIVTFFGVRAVERAKHAGIDEDRIEREYQEGVAWGKRITICELQQLRHKNKGVGELWLVGNKLDKMERYYDFKEKIS